MWLWYVHITCLPLPLPEIRTPISSRHLACLKCVYNISFNRSSFRKSDAFIGFQKDTPASVIFQATNLLKSACAVAKEGVAEGRWVDILKWSHWHPDDRVLEGEDYQKSWEENVSWTHVQWALSNLDPWNVATTIYTAYFKNNTNPFLKWGHPLNRDTLIGPNGAQNGGGPL